MQFCRNQTATSLVTTPDRVGKVFSECLAGLGGDPEFQVADDVLQIFVSWLPKCTKDQPPPMPTSEWLDTVTSSATPAKATGEDEVNYYIISLCPPSIRGLFLAAIHHVLQRGPPPEWARARVCVLYKKGDERTTSKYPPICLIQSIVKLAATWQCAQLTAFTSRHSLLHKCQHGGLKNHRCGDHIYDVV